MNRAMYSVYAGGIACVRCFLSVIQSIPNGLSHLLHSVYNIPYILHSQTCSIVSWFGTHTLYMFSSLEYRLILLLSLSLSWVVNSYEMYFITMLGYLVGSMARFPPLCT